MTIDYEKTTSITNLRDIGGYPAEEGRLKSGIFFRSGELCSLSNKDTDLLEKGLHLKKIYDFRRPAEIESRPDVSLPNIAYENISIISSPGQANPSLKNMVITTNIEKYMFSVYSELVLSTSAQIGYHHFLRELLATPQPIIFHCFAGKDRTGFAAALLLKIAGVNTDDIYADYLKTNEARKAENAKILQQFSTRLSNEKLKALAVSLNVKAEYLQHAFKLIREKFGSFDNYLQDGLQLENGYVDKFRQLYIS
ncbi:tyrosine-protein phosphatase [Liquorilactobacillus oeni]|uniref:tyrosine-protein phosphatase n=1 Tax=Liquorilactobacillus oeni TaxID=303241 RepID=UPI00070D0C59|nr:tyrosine-protein phosphatase [Liquorilactobacillus oeni]